MIAPDRELLELAAKAAAIEGSYFEGVSPIHTGIFRAEHDYYWNPLISDSEALRLAVKLKISVEFNLIDHVDNVATLSWRDKWQKLICLSTIIDDDQLAIVRRAITRAAAEIGRSAP